MISLIVSRDLLAWADGFLSVQSRPRNSASAKQIMPQRLLHQGSAPAEVWDHLSTDWTDCAVSSQAFVFLTYRIHSLSFKTQTRWVIL